MRQTIDNSRENKHFLNFYFNIEKFYAIECSIFFISTFNNALHLSLKYKKCFRNK